MGWKRYYLSLFSLVAFEISVMIYSSQILQLLFELFALIVNYFNLKWLRLHWELWIFRGDVFLELPLSWNKLVEDLGCFFSGFSMGETSDEIFKRVKVEEFIEDNLNFVRRLGC